MTRVRSPAASAWVTEPVSRSPGVRLGVAGADDVAAAALVSATAALEAAGDEAAETVGLMETLGQEHPASPPARATTSPAPASLAFTFGDDIPQFPPVHRCDVTRSGGG